MIRIAEERLANAKRAFTTRNVHPSALTKVVAQADAPKAGDLVLARITEVGAHKRLELPSSRKALLFAGDEVILAYGNRYAPDQFEAYVPDDMGPCHLAAGGGIAARVVNKNERMSDPTAIEPIGLFVDSEGMTVNVRDYALRSTAPLRHVPGFAVVGGSMNAGKTTTAACLVRGLTRAGYRVGAAKLTGTGAGNDYWHMRDAGAIKVLDFTDAGLATTFRASHSDLELCVNTLTAHLIDAGAEALVFEVADGLYQDETAWLVGSHVLRKHVDAFLYAGESAASSAMGVQWLSRRANYAKVLGVSGLVSSSPLAAREAETATGLKCFTRDDLASSEIAQDFLRTLTEERVVQAA